MFDINTVLLILIGILIFELLIFSHEFGHFITAKLSGVRVNEFALGMGPKLFSFKKKETEYSLRLFPIGGYCAMEGEDEESDRDDAFGNAKVWKRMIIVCAGAIMNILLGLVLVFFTQVQYDHYADTTIKGFYSGAYTEQSGLKAGDDIKKIGDYSIYSSNDISFAIAMLKSTDVDGTSVTVVREKYNATLVNVYNTVSQNKKSYNSSDWAKIEEKYNSAISVITTSDNTDEIVAAYDDAMTLIKSTRYADSSEAEIPPVQVSVTKTSPRFRTDVEVVRGGEHVTLKDVDFYTYMSEEEKPALAIDFYMNAIPKTFASVIISTFDSGISIVRMVYKSLIGLITGRFGLSEISGPVGVVSAVKDVASAGLETSFLDAVNNIVYIMSVISINLGVFNMLPIPALDGGRFFFLIIEAIRRKPIPAKYEGLVHGIGFAILILFILIVSANDIVRLFNGTGIFS